MLGFFALNQLERCHFEHFKVYSGSYGNLKQCICWLLVEGAFSFPAMSCDSAGSIGVILLTACSFETNWSKKLIFYFWLDTQLITKSPCKVQKYALRPVNCVEKYMS